MLAPEQLAELCLPVAGANSAQDPSSGTSSGATEPAVSATKGGQAAVTKKSGADGARGEEDSQPFILSEGLAPVPAKLVAKILKGDFVDMAELLRDNLEAQRRGILQDPACRDPTPSTVKLNRREIPDVLSWVQCFGIYMAVVASKQPEKLRQLLAYQTLIVREARRCGGRGWLAYDTMFRQQAAGDSKADWSKLNNSLYAGTFMTQSGKGKSCLLCLESDHSEEECALARPKPPHDARSSGGSAPGGRPTNYSGGGGRAYRGREKPVCFSYNRGECTHPYCHYNHVCLKCGSRSHPVVRCQASGNDSEGRRGGRDPKPTVGEREPRSR